MQLLQLVQDQVRLGIPLPWGIRDAHGKLLLARGQVLTNQAQMDALLSRGAFVDEEEMKAVRRREADAPSENLFGMWEHLLMRLAHVLRSSTTQANFPGAVDELARALIDLARRDADIGIYLVLRQDPNRHALYGVTHSVHVALVCLLMGQRLGWGDARVLTLVKAALTMNIAMIDLQGRLAAQSMPLTENQQAEVRAHPLAGVQMLSAAGVDDQEWLQAVAQHHELPGGNGYPHALAQVSELACALRHADVFTAKISLRAGRPALPANHAARELFMEGQGDALASALIKEFGIYPPGCFVKLLSGETAVVVRRGTNANAPLVACLTNRTSDALAEPVRRDTSQREYAIVGIVPDKNVLVRVPAEKLYGFRQV